MRAHAWKAGPVQGHEHFSWDDLGACMTLLAHCVWCYSVVDRTCFEVGEGILTTYLDDVGLSKHGVLADCDENSVRNVLES